LGVANRDLGTVQRIDREGQLSVKMDNGKAVTFDATQMRHFDHGYAVTSHSAQGLTADRVIVNVDTEVHPELINSRFAYVSVSRASHDAQVFTNNAEALLDRLSHDVTKTSAIAVSNVQNANADIGLESHSSPKTGFSIDLGSAL
jgi:ATP-dependent exoDNAse (exonuclease V) alpha subunit